MTEDHNNTVSQDNDHAILDNILYYIEHEGFEYQLYEHEHVHSSADAAKTRGTKLHEAAKALVLELKFSVAEREQRASEINFHNPRAIKEHANGKLSEFIMCIVSGDQKLDLKKIKEELGCKNLSLAHPDDVLSVTGCKVGTVPPWPVLFMIRGFVDSGVLENEHMVFSAGSHYKSIRMRSAEWHMLADAKKIEMKKE